MWTLLYDVGDTELCGSTTPTPLGPEAVQSECVPQLDKNQVTYPRCFSPLLSPSSRSTVVSAVCHCCSDQPAGTHSFWRCMGMFISAWIQTLVLKQCSFIVPFCIQGEELETAVSGGLAGIVLRAFSPHILSALSSVADRPRLT